ILSAFVALTLTPMVATRLLKQGAHDSRLYRKTEPFFVGLASSYRRTLRGFLRVRWLALPLLLLSALGVVLLFQNLPKEVAPLEDRAQLRVQVTAPEGVTY